MTLKSIWKAVEAGLVRAGRGRVRTQLLAMDDRLVEDCGFSRELLERGIESWPWRSRPEDPVTWRPTRAPRTTSTGSNGVLARAAAELRAYTDEELSELGISRYDIERAVQRGRTGVEGAHRRAA